MSFNDEHSQIRSRLSAQIGSIPVAWANVSFTPPNPQTIWVRLNILDGDMFQTTIGATTNNHRVVGIIVVQVFAPLNSGSSAAITAADSVAAIFRNWCGTTVRCRSATIRDVGPDGQGWYQVNVTIPFQRDELI